MRRTTIRLDSRLLADAKKLAADSDRTLTSVLEEALREIVGRQKSRRRSVVSLTTVDGRGVHPGVDLDDTAALLDLMVWRRPSE